MSTDFTIDGPCVECGHPKTDHPECECGGYLRPQDVVRVDDFMDALSAAAENDAERKQILEILRPLAKRPAIEQPRV